jgi:D-alanine-D-alanine ligase-like ATP-grasp enzyme
MIAVLMGGYSTEREISLMSGKAVYKALLKNNVE